MLVLVYKKSLCSQHLYIALCKIFAQQICNVIQDNKKFPVALQRDTNRQHWHSKLKKIICNVPPLTGSNYAEVKIAIKTRQVAHESNEKSAQRWMNIKEKYPLKIETCKSAKVNLIKSVKYVHRKNVALKNWNFSFLMALPTCPSGFPWSSLSE